MAVLGVLLWAGGVPHADRSTGMFAKARIDAPRNGSAVPDDPLGRGERAQPHNASATDERAETLCVEARTHQIGLMRERLDPHTSPDAALADALLLHVQREFPENDGSFLGALHAAVERWPDDVPLSWQYFHACHSNTDCDTNEALEQLSNLDGENAMTWMAAMWMAQSRGDVRGEREALRKAVGAPVYDTQWGNAFLALRPVLGSLPLPESCHHGILAMQARETKGRVPTANDFFDLEATSIGLALGSLDPRPLMACRSKRLPEETLPGCVSLLGRVAQGDTLLERNLALRHLIALTPDAEQRAALREQYRRVLWLSTQGAEFERIEGFAWRTWAEGEIPLLVAHVTAQGRWPPPAAWLPESEEQRAIVLDRDPALRH